MTTIRPRELERILKRLDARVCVTVDRGAGFEHSAAVAEMAPRLPALRHRVVLGSKVTDGEIDFAEFFEQTPWAARHPMPLDDAWTDPDRSRSVVLGRDRAAAGCVYDTGDLAVPDGRDGIRIIGRASDRIGGTFMVPANDVETALLGHPAVDDVALVGDPDGEGGELACAVVVARTQQPTLAQLREYLTTRQMTEWYQPARFELVDELPRNDNGKVRKELLSRWLRGEAGLTED